MVGGFASPDVVTTILSKEFYAGAKGHAINVFDLRRALAASGRGSGFVLDPYLHPTAQPATCKGLLVKLNDDDHGARRLRDDTIADVRTDFLSHTDEHPARPTTPPSPPRLRLRGL